MNVDKTVYCPHCKQPMDVDSRVISQETLLKNPKTSCVTKASCMTCLIQVTIEGNLRSEKQVFQEEVNDNIVLLLQEMLHYIPKENRPAFVTARKKELEESFSKLEENDDGYKKIKKALDFLDSYINNEPWGEYQ
jgi:ElaB/YqjD/DUF883 family membrane-anchored ribosome-binding protein